MTTSQLGELLKEVLKTYWRQKVAIKMYKITGSVLAEAEYIEYSGVPELGFATGYLSREEKSAAFEALEYNLQHRVPSDLLMAMLSHFESFLAYSLTLRGADSGGTLGALQRKVETHYSVNVDDIARVDELRERRNVLVHHHGVIDSKYSLAASKVVFPPWVLDPTTIATVGVQPEYLTYAVDTLVRYASNINHN